MKWASLAQAFFTSIAIHLAALMMIALAWGWLRAFSPAPDTNGNTLVLVAPLPEPVPEPEELAVSPQVPEQEITPPPLPPVSEPVPAPMPEPIMPPKIIDKPPRPEPRPKPVPTPKPVRVKKPAPEVRHEAAAGSRDASGSKPGPRLPLSDDSQQAAGNVLGPPSAPRDEARPMRPAEGGEAGAGNLFGRGDVGVTPGSGVGGGSGASGRGGLGLGERGGGAQVGGLRAGPGGEGSGAGGGSTSPPRGGYQVKPRYPDSARRQGIEGTVLVKAYVSEQGRVEQVQVEQSAGHRDLDQAAVEAVGRWRFEPARQGRQPIAMWVTIPVKFVLNR